MKKEFAMDPQPPHLGKARWPGESQSDWLSPGESQVEFFSRAWTPDFHQVEVRLPGMLGAPSED